MDDTYGRSSTDQYSDAAVSVSSVPIDGFVANDRLSSCLVISLYSGVAFKNAIGLFAGETTTITTSSSPEGVHVSSTNNDGNMIHEIMLHAEEMLFYRYDCRDEDTGELSKKTVITFDAERFHNCLKSINSASGVCMYFDSETQALVITQDLQDHFGDNASFVPALRSCGDIHGVIDDYTAEPFRMGVSDLCGKFKKAVDLKCKVVGLKWRNQCLTVVGYSPENTVLYRSKSCSGNFDEMDYEDEDIDAALREFSASSGMTMRLSDPPGTISFTIHAGAVKALCKIKQVAHPGAVIKLYFQEGMDLQLRCSVASYGTMKIHIKNSS